MEERKMKKYSIIIAAVLALAACSREELPVNEQPAGNPVYTMTVKATKSADNALTRALEIKDGSLEATWTEGDVVKIFDASDNEIGSLTAQGSGATVTLKGSMENTVKANDVLTLKFLGNEYGSHDGTLTGTGKSIDKVCDYSTASITVSEIKDGIVTTSEANFERPQAIIKFTLKDGSSNINPSSLSMKYGETEVNLADIPAETYSTNGEGVIFVAVPCEKSGQDVSISAVAGGDDYFLEKTGVTFEKGKYYSITANMTKGFSLNSVNGDITLKDGYTLTGTLDGYEQPYKISIAAGAKVTLKDATINGYDSYDYTWSGITGEGDATITLEGDNVVKGFYERFSGLRVPDNSTLTINGEGTLDVSSNGMAAGIGSAMWDNSGCGNIVIEGNPVIKATGGKTAAGIGSCWTSNNFINNKCGNITIKGGTITAIGGHGGAGIGTAYGSTGSYLSTCGDITITGGTIIATGGYFAAAIGGGGGSETDKYTRSYYSVGDITITEGVTKVVATKGEGKISEGGFSYAPAAIGHGLDYYINGMETSPRHHVGTVTVGSNQGSIFESPYTYEP